MLGKLNLIVYIYLQVFLHYLVRRIYIYLESEGKVYNIYDYIIYVCYIFSVWHTVSHVPHNNKNIMEERG